MYCKALCICCVERGNTTAGVTHPVYGRGNEDFGVAVVSSVQPSPIASPFNLTPATNNKGSISTPTSQAAQQALLGAPFLQDFIACCLRRNPTERWTAEVLLKHHPFMSTIDNGTALFERNRGRGRRSDEIGRDSVIRDLVNEAFAFCPQLNLHRDIRQGEQSVGQSGTHVSTKQSPGDLSSTPLHDTAPHFPTPVSKNRKKGYNFSNLDGLGKVFIESKAMMGPYPVVSDTQSVHYKSEHNRNLEKSAHVCVEAGRVDEKSDLNNGDKVHGNHNKPKSGGDGSKEQQCYVSSKMGTSTCGNLEPTTKAPHDTMNKRDECHNGYSSASREVLSTILLPAAKAAPNTARRIAALFAPLIEGQTDGRKADMQYKLGVQSVVESSKDEGCDSHGHANTRDALLSLATHGGATLTTETTAVNGNNSDLFVSPVSSFRANLERKHKESVNLMERQIELLYKLEAKHHGFAAEFVSRFVSSLIGQPQHQKQDAAGEGRAKGADNSATEETAMCQSINADDKQHIKSAAKGYDPIVRHIFDLTAMLCTDPNDPSNALSSVSQALREAEVPKVPPNCKRMSTDTEACDITGGNKRDSIDETVKSAQFPQSKRGEQQPLLLIREPPKWSNISLYQRRWELDFHSRGANADAAAVVPPPVIPFYGESSALPPPRMPSSSSFPNHHRDKEYVDATSLLYNSWMEESYRHISSL